MRKQVNFKFSTGQVNRRADSLVRAGAPTTKIIAYKDSLSQKGKGLLNEINAQQSGLQSKLSTRYDNWLTSARKKYKLDSMSVKAPALPSASLPGIPNQPNLSVPQVPALESSPIPTLNSSDFVALPLSPELKQVAGDFTIPTDTQLKSLDSQLPNTNDLVKPYASQLGEVKNSLKDPGKTAETQVSQLAETQGITSQADAINQLKDNEAMQVAEQMKGADSAEALLPAAVDHFAGKEVVLQQAMDQMAKYKDKYRSLPSIADVKKTWWPRNSLKGVPFRDRIRIGMNLGFRSVTDTLLLDFFPNASYRISGRFEAGMGFLYRVRVNTREFSFSQQNPVWGWNTFVVVKTFKSVFLRVEMDGTSYSRTRTDNASYRDWRWSFLSGIQTNFRIATQWTGNVQMLYNFDNQLKDGFPEKLSVRLGVQYKLGR
ncbi:MAG: hypothetical protein JNN04_09490 [Cyclobacteriaceae bacterium]|nr:hypothetical protein [Cyclobacteriaceae bacterium]